MASSKIIYALDIGNSSIKLLKCQYAGSVPEVLEARCFPLAADFAGIYDEERKSAVWMQSIEKMLAEEHGEGRKKIVVSLPGDLTFTRYITLPSIPLSKIAKIIRFEAEQQIPFLLSDVEWAYAVLPTRGAKEIDIVIAAAKKNFIMALVDVLAKYNFDAESFEVSQVVLNNVCYASQFGADGTILVDIGAHSSQVVLMYQGISWGRSLRQGTYKMTKLISDRTNISVHESERLKKTHGETSETLFEDKGADFFAVEKEDVVDEVVTKGLLDLVNDVSRTISYYLSLVRGAVFTKILLTGGGSNIRHVASFFEKNLGIRTEVADFTSLIKVAPYLVDRFSYDKNYYAVAVGLACSQKVKKRLSANVITEHLRKKGSVKEKKNHFSVCFCIVIVILCAVLANLFFELSVKKDMKAAYDAKLVEIQKERASLTVVEAALMGEVKKLEVLTRYINERAFLPDFFTQMHDALSDVIWIEGVDYDSRAKTMVLSGKTTETLADIHTFANKLRMLTQVKKIVFEEANIAEEIESGKEYRLFTLQIYFVQE